MPSIYVYESESNLYFIAFKLRVWSYNFFHNYFYNNNLFGMDWHNIGRNEYWLAEKIFYSIILSVCLFMYLTKFEQFVFWYQYNNCPIHSTIILNKDCIFYSSF